MSLPVNINELISGKIIESERIEYKTGWNPGSVYRTICAFANDFSNIGGGYIIIGAKARNGIAERPVKGIEPEKIDDIQREMIGLNNLIRPVYFPRLSIEDIDDRKVIVIWVPGGENRLYEVPKEIKARIKDYQYYIRRYSSTVLASKEDREELISLANKVPFDDRPNTNASLNDVSLLLIRDHLSKTGSRLFSSTEQASPSAILEQMLLLSGPPEQQYLRNVSLMMFSEKPHSFFPYTQVDIVLFPEEDSSPEFFEVPSIKGPIPTLIEKTLSYLNTHILKQKVKKEKGKTEVERIWNYPYEALEEVVVNALYHRDYQVREPVEIRIYSESIVVINHGGPDRSINMSAFERGSIHSRRYRNRRLGDFLKELNLSEGRATGIPLIRRSLAENGSPAPRFNTDENRSFFEVELFIHPAFVGEELPFPETEVEKKESIEIGDTTHKILELIKMDHRITIADMATQMGISTRSVEKHVAVLKEEKKLQRVGSKKTGFWKIP